jgi:hypothetical protein
MIKIYIQENRTKQTEMWRYNSSHIIQADINLQKNSSKKPPKSPHTACGVNPLFYFILRKRSEIVKQSRYRSGVAQRVPGS